MLYQLLTGRQPYVNPGARVSPYAILAAVQADAPVAVHKVDPRVPAELVAVCDKAMARDLSQRYPDMRSLGDDLRAYLEKRVVHAYRTGPLAELITWVRRNRTMATVVLIAAIGISATLLQTYRSQRRTEQAMAAWSRSTLVDLGPSNPAPPSPGIVRFRRPWNGSVFGGYLLEVHYAGPRQRIQFVLRTWQGKEGKKLTPDPERVLFDLEYEMAPHRGGALPPAEFSRGSSVYIFRFEKLMASQDGVVRRPIETIACLRRFNPDLLDESLSIAYGEWGTRVDWSPIGHWSPPSEYQELSDSEDVLFVEGRMVHEGREVHQQVVARFR